MSTHNWPTVPLGELLTKSEERVPVAADGEYRNFGLYSFGRGVFEKQPILGSASSATHLFRARSRQFVYSRLFAFEGAYALVPEEFDGYYVSNEFPLFSCDESRLLPQFLGWYFRNPNTWPEVALLTTGMGNRRQRVKPNALFTHPIPLPPLEEQRRIVARIDRLATKIDEARSIRKHADIAANQLFGSFCNDLFKRRMSQKVSTIPLGQIADIRSGVTLGREINGDTASLPYLRVANVQDGYLDLSSVKQVSIRPDERDKWTLKPGDLLLTEGGDWDKLGRGTVWQGEIADCIHQNHIFRVRIKHPDYLPYYLLTLTRSPYGREFFQSASKQTTNLASINQRQLKDFPVFQLQRREQQQVIEELSNLNSKIETLQSQLSQTASELSALLPSILDRAFKGEL